MAMDSVAEARLWIGTPYVHQASVKGVGCDCLGLLRGVFAAALAGEPIPPYDPAFAIGGEEILRDGLARHFREIPCTDIGPGDVVLFRMTPRAAARHCGIVGERQGRLTLIHARQNTRVREEPFSPLWRQTLAYAFRAP